MEVIHDAPEVIAICNYLAQSAGPKLHGTSLTPDTELLSSGVLDSLGTLQLITYLAEHFNIEVADEDFIPENFQSVRSLAGLVQSKRAVASTR